MEYLLLGLAAFFLIGRQKDAALDYPAETGSGFDARGKVEQSYIADELAESARSTVDTSFKPLADDSRMMNYAFEQWITNNTKPFPKTYMLKQNRVSAGVILEKIASLQKTTKKTLADLDLFSFLIPEPFAHLKTLPFTKTGSVIVEIESPEQLQFLGGLYAQVCFELMFLTTSNEERKKELLLWRLFFAYNRFELTDLFTAEILRTVDGHYDNNSPNCGWRGPGTEGRMLEPLSMGAGGPNFNPDVALGYNCTAVDWASVKSDCAERNLMLPGVPHVGVPSKVPGVFEAVKHGAMYENSMARFYLASFILATEKIQKGGDDLQSIANVFKAVFGFVSGAVSVGLRTDVAGGIAAMGQGLLTVVGTVIAMDMSTYVKYQHLQDIFLKIESVWNQQQIRLFDFGYARPYLTKDAICAREFLVPADLAPKQTSALDTFLGKYVPDLDAVKKSLSKDAYFTLNKPPLPGWQVSRDDIIFDGFFPNYYALIYYTTTNKRLGPVWNITAPQISNIIGQVNFQMPFFYTPSDNDLLTLKPDMNRRGLVLCMEPEEIAEQFLQLLK